ncbi:MAG: glycosyltransferase family 39 protein [Candidatus Gastranaerophilales bacterium]|nr:glycosyltransferase family 39 protein [Candidatus Gastranaerophilales bacterium]
MDKIKELYKNNTNIFNLLIIALVIVIGFLIFKDNYNGILTDKGRELLFPEAIANGKVLYKDILCIYFPFAFQINALFFKIFSPHLNVLIGLGLINTFVMGGLLYYIAKEFLSKNISLFFVVIYVMASAFNGTLFNSILPYSTSFTYGITAFVAGVLCAVKYVKSENARYIRFAYLAGGFAFACKSEFALLFLVLALSSLFLKPQNIKNNILNLLLYAVFPCLSCGILLYQGVTIEHFMSALDFMHRFFTTDAMIYHVTRTGALPSWEHLFMYLPAFFRLFIFITVTYFLYRITRHNKLFMIIAAFGCVYIANFSLIDTHTLMLPILMSLFVIIRFKELLNNKPLLVLTIASLFLNIRMFWALNLNVYGMLTAHILILSLLILMFTYMRDFKGLSKDDFTDFITYLMFVYLLFYIAFDVVQTTKNTTPLKTPKGTIYLPKAKSEALDFTLKYIKQYTKPEQKILVLPEGMAINFFSDRQLDYSLPMIDRLYHDAMNEDEIIEKLKQADYELILVVKGYGLTNFGKPYLYSEDNGIMEYIKDNYFADYKTEYTDGKNTNTMTFYIKPYSKEKS